MALVCGSTGGRVRAAPQFEKVEGTASFKTDGKDKFMN